MKLMKSYSCDSMDLKVEITHKEEVIVEISIRNGRWKYWDNLMDEEEKIPLTVNNINESYYLSKPVKDVYPFYDYDKYEETGEIVMKEAHVRAYNSLLSFLDYRIGNVKEDIKKGNYDRYYENGRIFTATMFKDDYRQSELNVLDNLVYKCEGMIEVKIEKMK